MVSQYSLLRVLLIPLIIQVVASSSSSGSRKRGPKIRQGKPTKVPSSTAANATYNYASAISDQAKGLGFPEFPSNVPPTPTISLEPTILYPPNAPGAAEVAQATEKLEEPTQVPEQSEEATPRSTLSSSVDTAPQAPPSSQTPRFKKRRSDRSKPRKKYTPVQQKASQTPIEEGGPGDSGSSSNSSSGYKQLEKHRPEPGKAQPAPARVSYQPVPAGQYQYLANSAPYQQPYQHQQQYEQHQSGALVPDSRHFQSQLPPNYYLSTPLSQFNQPNLSLQGALQPVAQQRENFQISPQTTISHHGVSHPGVDMGGEVYRKHVESSADPSLYLPLPPYPLPCAEEITMDGQFVETTSNLRQLYEAASIPFTYPQGAPQQEKHQPCRYMVTRSTFGSKKQDVLDAVSEANFLSWDLEMTGIHSVSEAKTLNELISLICTITATFDPVQIGLVAFKLVGGKFEARPFSFLVGPGHPRKTFVSQTSTLRFLNEHAHSWDYWSENYIPFAGDATPDMQGVFMDKKDHENLAEGRSMGFVAFLRTLFTMEKPSFFWHGSLDAFHMAMRMPGAPVLTSRSTALLQLPAVLAPFTEQHVQDAFMAVHSAFPLFIDLSILFNARSNESGVSLNIAFSGNSGQSALCHVSRVPEGFNSDSSHSAAYDAWMTGVVGISALLKTLDSKQQPTHDSFLTAISALFSGPNKNLFYSPCKAVNSQFRVSVAS